MKTATDPRHLKRKKAIQSLFAESFTKQKNHSKIVSEIIGDLKKIDKVISSSAPAWPIEKINKIDLAILRYATWEILNTQTPPKVVIDEAVELAKELGAESSSSFVNGVMGTVYSNMDRKKKE